MSDDYISTAPGRRCSSPRRRLTRVAAFGALVAAAALAPAGRTMAHGMLVSQSEAARLGLERAWYAQTPVDPARSRVTSWQLHHDNLYCVTDSGLISAFNSETGERLWTKQVGRPNSSAFGPDANSKYVGVVSGSRLYMLDRATGRLEWSRVLGSAPSSGPALTEDFAFIALVTGRIEGYRLRDPVAMPWYYQSKGRTYLRPTTTGRVVSWPTSLGYLYASRADDPGVLFRLETDDDIVTSPAEKEPYLYIASLDGYLYSIDELSGQEQWRYSTGYPVVSSPAIVGDQAYVASLEPMLHAIDSTTGQGLWKAPGVSHFAALGKDRVYASDKSGSLLVLDAKTGRPLGGLKVAEGSQTLVNDQTDRIFIVHDHGLIQCLHEIGVQTPTLYRTPFVVEAADEDVEATGEAAEDATPAEPSATDEPAADAEEPADAAEVDEPPAEEPGEEPAEEPADDADMDNPFDVEQ